MSVERRARLTPDERRSQLVAIGVEFLTDHPLDDLTIDELATRAGVSRALIFHYFDTRQGVHHAVVSTARDALLDATLPRSELPPRERVHDTLLRIAEFVRHHRGTFFSLVRGVASADPIVRAVVDEARESNADHLRVALVELGEADTPALRTALRAWVSFAEEVFIALAVDEHARGAALVSFLERTLDGVVAAARDTVI